MKNDIQSMMLSFITSEIENYLSDINSSIDFILRNYIDKPIIGKITKGKLRYRGIKTISYCNGVLIGIIQRDSLITVDGYKVPYKNNHFCFEEKIKI